MAVAGTPQPAQQQDPLNSILGPVAGGVMNLVGGLFQQSNQDSQALQAEQYQTQSIQSQENYATQMSDTAYQRSVADMTAAGLNPALMYGSGGPESSPQGSSASGVTAPQSNVLGNAVNAGMTTASQVADITNTMAQTKATLANAGLTDKKSIGQDFSNVESEMEAHLFKTLDTLAGPVFGRLMSTAQGTPNIDSLRTIGDSTASALSNSSGTFLGPGFGNKMFGGK